MRRSSCAIVGGAVAALAMVSGCLSDDNATPPMGDAGSFAIDAAPPAAIDAGPHDATVSDAHVADAPQGDDVATDDAPFDAASDADAAASPVVLSATATNVVAEGDDTLTVALNGITATSVEIDDGATAIATLTAAPYTVKVHYSYSRTAPTRTRPRRRSRPRRSSSARRSTSR